MMYRLCFSLFLSFWCEDILLLCFNILTFTFRINSLLQTVPHSRATLPCSIVRSPLWLRSCSIVCGIVICGLKRLWCFFSCFLPEFNLCPNGVLFSLSILGILSFYLEQICFEDFISTQHMSFFE